MTMIYRSTAIIASLLYQIITPVASAAEQNQTAPKNGFMANGEWHCFSGHRKEGNRCISILAELAAAPIRPSNSTRVTFADEQNQAAPKPSNHTRNEQYLQNAQQPSNAVVNDPYLAAGGQPVLPHSRNLETIKVEPCGFSVQPGPNCGEFSRNIIEARAGQTQRYIAVATQYMYGIGTNKDPEKAIYWATRAAKEEIPEAYILLSQWYLLSVGLNQDIQKSYDYLVLATESGYKSPKLLEIQKHIRMTVGKYPYRCLRLGLTYKSIDFATCAIRMEEAAIKLEFEKRRLAMEEQAMVAELQQRTKEAEILLAESQERGRQIAAEIENSERRAREKSAAALLDIARDLGSPTYSQPNNYDTKTAKELRNIRECLGDRRWC